MRAVAGLPFGNARAGIAQDAEGRLVVANPGFVAEKVSDNAINLAIQEP